MFVSVAAVLGATLGTVSGALTLCGLSLLCKNCKKNKFEQDESTDSERAKASILHTLTQEQNSWSCSDQSMPSVKCLRKCLLINCVTQRAVLHLCSKQLHITETRLRPETLMNS